MLQIRFARRCENWFVIDSAMTELRTAHLHFTFGTPQEVLDMDHRKSLRIPLEVLDGIVTGKAHPAAVDLELDELPIGLLQKHVIADRAALLGHELEVVVVVSQLQACASC